MTPAQQAFINCQPCCSSSDLADCFEWLALEERWDEINYDIEGTRIL